MEEWKFHIASGIHIRMENEMGVRNVGKRL